MFEISKFVKIIKELMLTNEISSSKELAKAAGFSQTTLNRWFNGLSVPALASLVKLADYFDCSVDFIVGRKR